MTFPTCLCYDIYSLYGFVCQFTCPEENCTAAYKAKKNNKSEFINYVQCFMRDIYKFRPDLRVGCIAKWSKHRFFSASQRVKYRSQRFKSQASLLVSTFLSSYHIISASVYLIVMLMMYFYRIIILNSLQPVR